MAYTTAELDTKIAELEAKLSSSKRLRFQDNEVENRDIGQIRDAIAYFQAQYNDASDAPATGTRRIRTLLFNGTKGF